MASTSIRFVHFFIAPWKGVLMVSMQDHGPTALRGGGLRAAGRSKRGAVMIFLLGWFFLPLFVIFLGGLQRPWFQVGCVAIIAFIAILVVAMVRVVRNF